MPTEQRLRNLPYNQPRRFDIADNLAVSITRSQGPIGDVWQVTDAQSPSYSYGGAQGSPEAVINLLQGLLRGNKN